MADFDPSDWKKSRLPKLAQLDSLQRCLICKDYLKAPVITSCNHTFCSQCIRQHLLRVSLCPLCKAEQFESNLKRVILLEEIVACFQALRPELIALATAPEAELAKTREMSSKSTEHGATAPVLNVKPQNTPNRPAALSVSRSVSPEVVEVSESGEEIPHVSCPVCNQRMTAEVLQRKHLDECLRGKSAPKRRREILLFFQPRKKPEVDHLKFYFAEAHRHHHDTRRIPKMDYASLLTPKLKEKLTLLHLSALGTRAQLELRYNHFYLLHNANLDSSRPVPDLELRQRLNQWEKSHLAFSAPVGANTVFGDVLSHKSISDKDFPVALWVERYRADFRRLVRQARRSRGAKAEAATPSLSGSGEPQTPPPPHSQPAHSLPTPPPVIDPADSNTSNPTPTASTTTSCTAAGSLSGSTTSGVMGANSGPNPTVSGPAPAEPLFSPPSTEKPAAQFTSPAPGQKAVHPDRPGSASTAVESDTFDFSASTLFVPRE